VFAGAKGRARAERDSQIEDPCEAIENVVKKQRHECEKVAGLEEAMGEVRRQIEGVPIKLSETEEAVERRGEWRRRPSYVTGPIRGRRSAGSDGRQQREC
jgi:hypothetical protein